MKELIHSTNPNDILLALLMDLDYCISLMNNKHVHTGTWLKLYEFSNNTRREFYWCKIKGKALGFRSEHFIGLINPEKEQFYRNHYPEHLIYDDTILS